MLNKFNHLPVSTVCFTRGKLQRLICHVHLKPYLVLILLACAFDVFNYIHDLNENMKKSFVNVIG